VDNVEALGWITEHCRDRGYRSLNARGQEYDNPEAVVHNSIAIVIIAAVVTESIPVLVGAILWVLDAPTIGVPSTTSAPLGTTVTINGNNFESAMHVYFNENDLSFVLVSKTQFTTDFSTKRW